ncbi:hypothetical protein ScalyP_jg2044, partial [Parmales sp. scaly parma]
MPSSSPPSSSPLLITVPLPASPPFGIIFSSLSPHSVSVSKVVRGGSAWEANRPPTEDDDGEDGPDEDQDHANRHQGERGSWRRRPMANDVLVAVNGTSVEGMAIETCMSIVLEE